MKRRWTNDYSNEDRENWKAHTAAVVDVVDVEVVVDIDVEVLEVDVELVLVVLVTSVVRGV